MDAIYLINKPKGMTSFDVITKMRKVLQMKKIGHTGTLDPEASGLLIVLTGKCTKCIPYCVKNHKHYIAQFELGKASDTEDAFGTIMEERKAKKYSDIELQEIATRMQGTYFQTPPMYSAKKLHGKKFYEYARVGKDIEREAVKVEINQLSVRYLKDDMYEMDALVSSGTYIRTLIVDFAKKLGELAIMTSLQRIGIEHLSLDQSIPLEDFDENAKAISLFDCANPAYPFIEVENPVPILQGKKIELDREEEIVLLCYQKEVLAAYEKEASGRYHCLRGLF
ncbi:tRNA pseudouridine(55) synthase TruB [Bulleidia sp. zg-1006]|uniref:tRNA pseudouridine(55) synthase TruB n=1 Tax=Bulleidia sp. zg-1006 TaxID=2806552 RepID=UPI00193973B6|nr:tRNA pseudouridine(55) synthase TruB [Bulleidia sp. zg-1006]QRG87323.1 tRNA pseudouridine(55) synthase TruB [Bulleidia sp. zg-1006]